MVAAIAIVMLVLIGCTVGGSIVLLVLTPGLVRRTHVLPGRDRRGRHAAD